MGKLLLPFPSIPREHPFRHHLETLFKMISATSRDPTADAAESTSARLVIGVTESERAAIQVLAVARGWTSTYAIRRGIQLVIDEALDS